jgi:hypothetical protein
VDVIVQIRALILRRRTQGGMRTTDAVCGTYQMARRISVFLWVNGGLKKCKLIVFVGAAIKDLSNKID